MLGVGGAAAIADDQELVARAQRRDDDGCYAARGGEQRRIAVARPRAASERSKWAAIGSVESLLKKTPSVLQAAPLVMIGPAGASMTRS